MPKSSLTELLFAFLFAVATTGIAGFMITSDTQTTARVRLLEIDRLKEERQTLQLEALDAWSRADDSGEKKLLLDQTIEKLTRRTPTDFYKDKNYDDVDKVYRQLEKRLRP